MSRVDENAELGRVIAEGAESGLINDKLVELLYIQDIGKSLAVIADSMRPTGHWLVGVDKWGNIVTTASGYICDKCNTFNSDKDKFCPYCGARMVESEK